MEKKNYIPAKVEILKILMEDVLSSSGFSGVEDIFPNATEDTTI